MSIKELTMLAGIVAVSFFYGLNVYLSARKIGEPKPTTTIGTCCVSVFLLGLYMWLMLSLANNSTSGSAWTIFWAYATFTVFAIVMMTLHVGREREGIQTRGGVISAAVVAAIMVAPLYYLYSTAA